MKKTKKIKLTKAEIQSGLNRQQHAELLILQMPKSHEGRNTWLLNYGIKEQAQLLRIKNNVKFDEKHQAAQTISKS